MKREMGNVEGALIRGGEDNTEKRGNRDKCLKKKQIIITLPTS